MYKFANWPKAIEQLKCSQASDKDKEFVEWTGGVVVKTRDNNAEDLWLKPIPYKLTISIFFQFCLRF